MTATVLISATEAGAMGRIADAAVGWLLSHGQPVFQQINGVILMLAGLTEHLLELPSAWLLAALLAGLGLWRVSAGFALFTLVGLNLVVSMQLWEPMIGTLALVLTSALLALLIGLPVGVLAARQRWIWAVTRPLLDLMQTMPAFVYLIPAVMLFSTGAVPAVLATVIFSMPPVVRLTVLGLEQVPKDLLEAGRSFGCSEGQLLMKVQWPNAQPTVMTGVNQTLMLALSMVVIASMIGGGGLGDVVLRGIQQLNIGLGFEGGLAVVILAVILDRLSQSLSHPPSRPLSTRLRQLWGHP